MPVSEAVPLMAATGRENPDVGATITGTGLARPYDPA